MRKRNVSHIADTVFWYALYMLPLILTVIQSIGIFSGMTFDDWRYISDNSATYDFGFLQLFDDNLTILGVNNGGLIFETLEAIFGQFGVLPIIYSPAVFAFAQWFVVTMLIHLCVDFILFIPRFAHKWMKKATEED